MVWVSAKTKTYPAHLSLLLLRQLARKAAAAPPPECDGPCCTAVPRWCGVASTHRSPLRTTSSPMPARHLPPARGETGDNEKAEAALKLLGAGATRKTASSTAAPLQADTLRPNVIRDITMVYHVVRCLSVCVSGSHSRRLEKLQIQHGKPPPPTPLNFRLFECEGAGAPSFVVLH